MAMVYICETSNCSAKNKISDSRTCSSCGKVCSQKDLETYSKHAERMYRMMDERYKKDQEEYKKHGYFTPDGKYVNHYPLRPGNAMEWLLIWCDAEDRLKGKK